MLNSKNNAAITVNVSDAGDTAGMFNTYQHIFKAIMIGLVEICSTDYTGISNIGFHTRIDKIVKDAQLDDLDLVELVMCIEEELEVEIDDGTIESSITVFDFVGKISKITGRLFDTDPVPATPVAVTDTSHDNDLGILVLPSLEEHGRLIVVQGVSIEEAKAFVNEHTLRVIANRKCKNALASPMLNIPTDNIEFYHNVIRFDQLDHETDFEAMDAELEELTNCNVPKTRGLRTLFISPTVIGVGTTVIYNKNWATLNFSDDTIYDQLKQIADDHS